MHVINRSHNYNHHSLPYPQLSSYLRRKGSDDQNTHRCIGCSNAHTVARKVKHRLLTIIVGTAGNRRQQVGIARFVVAGQPCPARTVVGAVVVDSRSVVEAQEAAPLQRGHNHHRRPGRARQRACSTVGASLEHTKLRPE